MGKGMSIKNHRDSNEAELVALARGLGCVWIQMPRTVGFDGLLASPKTGLHVVEVKNPARNWKLTQAEAAMRDLLTARSIPYNIVQTQEEMDALVRRKKRYHPANYLKDMGRSRTTHKVDQAGLVTELHALNDAVRGTVSHVVLVHPSVKKRLDKAFRSAEEAKRKRGKNGA